ncbi:hypothetical protein D1871_04685 [Nakamurella silvestris]|nr:hypothetical protein D1871_04685 [Nakamurella silvestris]
MGPALDRSDADRFSRVMTAYAARRDSGGTIHEALTAVCAFEGSPVQWIKAVMLYEHVTQAAACRIIADNWP